VGSGREIDTRRAKEENSRNFGTKKNLIDGISRTKQNKTLFAVYRKSCKASQRAKVNSITSPTQGLPMGIPAPILPHYPPKKKLQSRRGLLIESLEISAANENKKRDKSIQRILHVACTLCKLEFTYRYSPLSTLTHAHITSY
jgi:hypothetical protein